MIMSGVEDGLRLTYTSDNGDGEWDDAQAQWKISIGRREDSDICLRNDTFISRQHAHICWENGHWWLQDCNSTNGTFLEDSEADARVRGTIPLACSQLFRVGHTWMRVEDSSG